MNSHSFGLPGTWREARPESMLLPCQICTRST
jgi:hypothetical protein